MVTIFNASLTNVFQPTTPFVMSLERMTIDFRFVVSVLATVEWFLEFASDDPNAAGTQWFREVAEEDIGGGVVHMPNVVRDFTGMAAGTHGRDAQFVRHHRFCRIQIRASAGTVDLAVITSLFGDAAQSA